MNKYKTIKIITSKRNQNLISWYDQALDEMNQLNKQLIKIFGKKYETYQIYPYKKIKSTCPEKCGNRFIYIEKILYNPKRPNLRVLHAKCCNCNHVHLLVQEIIL